MNGNTNLATAKQNVQQAIDQLPNLNQAQRDEYNKQITQQLLYQTSMLFNKRRQRLMTR
ncbi:hypothetical protein ACVQ92_07080 [Staphylococcus aureus]